MTIRPYRHASLQWPPNAEQWQAINDELENTYRVLRVLTAANDAIDLGELNASSLTSGTVPAARMPGLTGDVSSVAGTVVTTLATTAVTAGTYGDSSHVARITVDTKGRLTAASEVAFGGVVATSVYRSASKSLTHNTETAIDFDTEHYDASNLWVVGTPTRFTCPTNEDGTYFFVGQIQLGTAFAGVAHLRLYKNGTLVATNSAQGADLTSGSESHSVTAVLSLVSTDYVELKVLLVLAAGSGTYSVVGGTNATFMQAVKSSPQVGSVSGDSTTTAAFASRPAASNDGNVFFPTDGFNVERDTGAAWVPWGPIYPFTAPSDTGFTWQNQGSSTIATTKDSLQLVGAGTNNATSSNLVCRLKTAPATPYTITAFLLPPPLSKLNQAYGIGFRQSGAGTGQNRLVLIYCDFTSVRVDKWSTTGAYSASYVTIPAEPPRWLRIKDDATTLFFYVSADGQNWVQIHSVSRIDYMLQGPDQVGFFVNTHNGATPDLDCPLTVLSWTQA